MGQTKTATFAELSFGSSTNSSRSNNNNNNSDGEVDVICGGGVGRKASPPINGTKISDFGVVQRVIVDMDTEDAANNNDNCSDNNASSTIRASAAAAGKTQQASADSTTSQSEPDLEYTYLFGLIKTQAKLKWVNIVGIVVIHCMFLYVFTQSPLMPSIYTYMWGKFLPKRKTIYI